MSYPTIITYSDMIDHLIEWAEGQGRPASQGAIRGAIESAYEDVIGAHDWPFLVRNGRIQMHAATTFSAASYDHTGGATCERQLTISGDTFTAIEDWVEDASLTIDGVVCDIESKKSSTVLQLDATMTVSYTHLTLPTN